MNPQKAVTAVFLAAALLGFAAARAEDMTLNTVLYPDGEKTSVEFQTTDRAPKAALSASVKPEPV